MRTETQQLRRLTYRVNRLIENISSGAYKSQGEIQIALRLALHEQKLMRPILQKKEVQALLADIIVDLTDDKLFMSNEEEVMHINGWSSIVNLWRVYEEREEIENDLKLRRKFGIEGMHS